METKRERQLINRKAGFTGSLMPLERAQSISRKTGLSVVGIRYSDQATKPRL